MSTHGSGSGSRDLKKGDNIDALRNADGGETPLWFPATVTESPSPVGKAHVKFDTESERERRKRIRDHVDAGVTRTVPPPDLRRCFVVGEEVEVFDEKGWRKGEVKGVLEDSKYMVAIAGGVAFMVEKSRVRVLRHSEQDKPGSKKELKLRIICTPNFHKGTPVEVKSDEQGYHGSWFVAKVVGSAGKDQLVVEYDTLVTDDERQPLVEMAHASHVRPLPPIINRIDRFKMLEEVDVWYNDGWWVGVISKVVSGLKYVVYFWTTNEELLIEHSKLRSHQELIDGKWVASFLRPKLGVKPRLEKCKIPTIGRSWMGGLLRGLKVEIAHGERGCCTTWYPAVILAHNGKLLVEYRTLKMDNGRELIKEEVDPSCVRPCPPIVQRAGPFEPCDEVEAWDDNGWRCGQVCRRVKGSKYAVYLRGRDTVVDFQHAELRARRDFVDGTWFVAGKLGLEYAR